MECKRETNKENCNCTSSGCTRKGICCDCLRHHLKSRQLPACCFPKDIEKTYNRSFEKFSELVEKRKI